ncbi:MAG: hypothetical protein L6R41_001614 [Letrouitia leprolyta]|nr:MAG: hypothetical protein L6R41_001614 [Letrouitia leprolyta]
MPVALHLWPLICFLCPFATRAGPAGPRSMVSSLSPYVVAVVPSCAHGCLVSFIEESFPSSTCQETSNLKCLCTSDSKTGLTLGEGALRCLASECYRNPTAIQQAINVYQICQSIPNANQPTHHTLTATHVTVTTVQQNIGNQPTTMSRGDTDTKSPFPSSIIRPSPTSVPETSDAICPTGLVTDTSIPAPILPTLDFTSTTPTASISVTTSEAATSTSASQTAAAASAAQPVLTKPQIAGVAVGSVAAAGLVFGLLALFFCLRERKRKNRRSSDASFGNDKIVVDEPRTPSPPPGPETQDVERGNRAVEFVVPDERQGKGISARRQSKRWSQWRKSMRLEDIGVAVAPSPSNPTQPHSPTTPMSAASYETTSQLLPDKPIYSLYPPPLRISSYNQDPSAVNQDITTVDGSGLAFAGFGGPLPSLAPRLAPRGRGTMDTSQTNLHFGQPTIRAVSSDPFLDSTPNDRPAAPMHLQTLPSQRNRSTLSKPADVHHGGSDGREIHRKPVPARLPLGVMRGESTIERLDWGAGIPSQPAATVAGPSSSSRVLPVRRKSSARRKYVGKRPETFLSTSDTSFEDGDSDDEPEPVSALSPLIESPPSQSRAAGVQYPGIPTSAAESPSISRTAHEVRREQIELNPASDRSLGRGSPRTPIPADKPLPQIPGSKELKERQQAPNSNGSSKVPPVKPGSAKHKILVASGQDGIENIGTPKSKSSAEWTPMSTPTRTRR